MNLQRQREHAYIGTDQVFTVWGYRVAWKSRHIPPVLTQKPFPKKHNDKWNFRYLWSSLNEEINILNGCAQAIKIAITKWIQVNLRDVLCLLMLRWGFYFCLKYTYILLHLYYCFQSCVFMNPMCTNMCVSVSMCLVHAFSLTLYYLPFCHILICCFYSFYFNIIY